MFRETYMGIMLLQVNIKKYLNYFYILLDCSSIVVYNVFK